MLSARTAAEFEGEAGKDVLDYVCAWLENGQTMLELARSLTAELNPGADIDDDVRHISPNMIRRVLLDYHERDKLDQRLRDSRTVAAFAMVDKATAIIDDVSAMTKEAVSHAKERANVRLWTSERYNRGELGGSPKTAIAIQVNAGEAHITAMTRRRERPVLPAAPVVEAQLVSGE